MSALLGSTKYKLVCRFERNRCAYWRKRVRRSSPPQEDVELAPFAFGSRTRGGYAVDEELLLLIGGDTDAELNERDSSSWKYNVGRVEPLIRLTATEPSA